MNTDKIIVVLTREMRISLLELALQSNEPLIEDMHGLALLRFMKNLLQSIAATKSSRMQRYAQYGNSHFKMSS